MRTLIVVAVLAVSGGCTKFVEMQKADPRIWVISTDMKEVFRCVDLVAADGHGKHTVECIKARVRSSDAAEE